MTNETDIKIFENKKVRSHWDEQEEQWYFSVVDIVEILTESSDPKDYWYRIKKREKLSGIELSTICRQLKLESADSWRKPLRSSAVKKLNRREPQSKTLSNAKKNIKTLSGSPRKPLFISAV